ADTDMALTRRLLPVALLALCWGLSMAGAQGTIPLQTLSCHNDYTSRIVCRWADTQDAQRFINVTLHRRDPPQPVACRLSDDTSWLDDSCLSCVPRSCIIPYKFFALADRDYFSFRPDRPLGAQLNINLAQHGDEAQPRDLQCFFYGAAALSCSWEVRTEVASSVSGPQQQPQLMPREEQCSPVLQDQPGSPYILHRCQIPVPDPRTHSQYLVSVRPKEEEKFIKSSENIQMVPPTLNVTRSTDGYVLLWKAEEMMYKHIGHTFEVQYKKDTASWEDSMTESLQNAHSMSLPRLEPSTKYQARVRVKPAPGGYNGVWSEWSEECSWVTEWGRSPRPPLPPTPGAAQLGRGQELNRKWEEKIPNPSKSHLFQVEAAWEGGWVGGAPLHLAPAPDCGHSEVSPLTTKDPKDAQDSPSEPDMTLTPSDLPAERPHSPQPGLAAPSGRPESRVSGFDFNGPYLGPPHSRSLPDMVGPLVAPQMDMGLKPLPSGSLEYLCLPAGGQVQLVPLSQAMGQGRAQDLEKKPSPGAEGSPSLESGADPVPPAPGLMVGGQGPKDSPAALPTASGGPADSGVASGYVTTADLTFTPPTGAPSVSQVPRLGPPSDQNDSVCPGLAGGPPGAPAPMEPEFEGYVELPPTTGQTPKSPLVSPAPPATSSPVLSLGEPRADAAPASPHPEGLLVLQQVGDYCFLPGVGSSPLSPQIKPSSPGPCPETGDLEQVLQAKKPSGQAVPQVPAIQLFKALKQQDYLALPPWDVARPGEVC
uniref:Fibronectin type-III domain-containing protein n=1 Tax=Equus asinus asinus TaxID=83772 RepID=A0A8C4MJQ4_EQUAS